MADDSKQSTEVIIFWGYAVAFSWPKTAAGSWINGTTSGGNDHIITGRSKGGTSLAISSTAVESAFLELH